MVTRLQIGCEKVATHQELKQAIAVLESHRDILDDATVDTALAALREKLRALQSPPPADLQQNTAVLVADLSGFTAMSEQMDAEEVRDTINAVWQKLDGVITAWGGQIDQHVGDGVVALFQATSDVADSAERATLAALDMQLELALFRERERGGTGPLGRPFSGDNLRMRIGIHAGAIIGYSQYDIASGRCVALASVLARFHIAGRGADHDPAVFAQRVAGVQHEIEQHLLKLRDIRPHIGEVGGKFEIEPALPADQLAEDVGVLVDERVEIQDAGVERLAAAEGEKLLRERRRLAAGVVNLGHLSHGLGIGGDMRREHLAVAVDDREKVVEIVRNPPRQPPDRIEPFPRQAKE